MGKTHLAITFAVAAAESGRRIYFGTLADLIDSFEDAHATGRLKQRLRTLTHPALLVVDEIGYLSVTPNGARLFFQLVNARYGRGSTVLTSNKGFEHWGEILHDEVMAATVLDRLLHRCHIVNIRGNSFWMRRHMELSKAIHPTASRAADAERAREGDESCAIFDARKCAISMPIDTGVRGGEVDIRGSRRLRFRVPLPNVAPTTHEGRLNHDRATDQQGRESR